MPSLSTILSSGSPSQSLGGNSSSPATASSLSLTAIVTPTFTRAPTALSSSASGHLIVLPPSHYQVSSQLSSSLFHSVPTITSRSNSLSLSSPAVDNSDTSTFTTKDDNFVDCDELLAEGSMLPKSFTFFNTSSLLPSYSSPSSLELEVFTLLSCHFHFYYFCFHFCFACFFLRPTLCFF